MNYKNKNIFVDVKQLERLAKKYNFSFCKNAIKHNELLFSIADHDKKIFKNYFFKKYHIQKFNFKYSCHNKIKKGGELLMSNIPMPDISKFIKQ